MVWGRKNRAVPPGLTGCGQPSKNLPLPSSVIMPNLVKHGFPKISDPWHLASRVRGVGDPVKSCPRQVWSLSKIFSLSMPHTLESLSTLKTCSYPRWVAMPNLVALGQSICAYIEESSNSLDPWDQTFKGHSRSVKWRGSIGNMTFNYWSMSVNVVSIPRYAVILVENSKFFAPHLYLTPQWKV